MLRSLVARRSNCDRRHEGNHVSNSSTDRQSGHRANTGAPTTSVRRPATPPRHRRSQPDECPSAARREVLRHRGSGSRACGCCDRTLRRVKSTLQRSVRFPVGNAKRQRATAPNRSRGPQVAASAGGRVRVAMNRLAADLTSAPDCRAARARPGADASPRSLHRNGRTSNGHRARATPPSVSQRPSTGRPGRATAHAG
jgi:hypothetical protein